MSPVESHPCRLVVHNLPDQESHIDIFVQINVGVPMPTFEAPITLLKFLAVWIEAFHDSHAASEDDPKKPYKNGLSIFVLPELPCNSEPTYYRKGETCCVPANRKEDHRPLYFDYIGPIDNHRGNIHHLAYGSFLGGVENVAALEFHLHSF